jgi:hypothetical protein
LDKQTEGESRLLKERGDIDLKLQDADAATRELLLNRQGAIDKELQALRGGQALEQIGAQSTGEYGLQELRGEQAIDQIGAQGQTQQMLQAERGKIDLMLQDASAGDRELLLIRQGQIDTGLAYMQQEHQMNLARYQGDEERELVDRRGKIQMDLAAADATTKVLLQAEQSKVEEELLHIRGEQQYAQAQYDYVLQELRGTQTGDINEQAHINAKELSNIENASAELRQVNQNASLYFSQVSSDIGAVLKEPDMSDTAKQEQIRKQVHLLESGLAVIEGISGVPVNKYLDFGSSGFNPDLIDPVAEAAREAEIENRGVEFLEENDANGDGKVDSEEYRLYLVRQAEAAAKAKADREAAEADRLAEGAT